MRGTRGSSPRRREQIDNLARGGDVDSLEYEEDNELPDLIMNIDDDVLEDRDEETESKDASVGYKRTQIIFMVLAVLGFITCIVLICLVAYFATTYVNASGNLQVARDSLQNTTESYLKLQQQAKQREEAHCTQFRNSTEHWLHLFCEKYECPSRICDPGWLLNSRNCYLFTNTRLTWEQSRAMCLNRHGHLAIASNSKVQSFLAEQAKDASFWIGLTDTVTEGSWVWVDGSKVRDGMTFWATGQPDNAYNRTYKMTENCGLLNLRRWYDEVCMSKFPAICEKNAIRLHLIFQRMLRSR